METVDWSGVALAIAALGTAIAVVINAFKTGKIVKATQGKVLEIDHAVNGKQPGAQSMVSQVDDLHKEIPIPLIPEAVNGAALLPLVKELYADMLERRALERDQRNAQEGTP